jgi:pimeloyl-ACP methyl ester carboxylesterase
MPTASANGLTLYYEEAGQGEPLLLIMGLGSQLVFWDPSLIAGLVERGFRVITFDHRDVGLSTRLDHLPAPGLRSLFVRGALRLPIRAPYTLDDMARDAIGLLDALAIERAHVVGSSMGGMIAQILAVQHRHRVLTLTSMNSHPGNTLSRVAKPRALRALFSPLPRGRQAAIERYVAIRRLIAGPGFPFDEHDMRDKATRAYDRAMNPAGVSRHIAAVAAAPNRVPELRRTDVPALVIHGTHDPLVPTRGGRLTARALPAARLRLIPGMGHELPRAVWPTLIDEIAELATRARCGLDGPVVGA